MSAEISIRLNKLLSWAVNNQGHGVGDEALAIIAVAVAISDLASAIRDVAHDLPLR